MNKQRHGREMWGNEWHRRGTLGAVMCCFPNLKAERIKLWKNKARNLLMIKNNNRYTLNMFSAVLASPVEAAVTGNRDNELRKIMKMIGCSGGKCEPTERRREFSRSFEWEQDSPAGMIPRLLKQTASPSRLWAFRRYPRLPMHSV